MDANVKAVYEKRIEKTIVNLKKNNMRGIYAPTVSNVVPLVEKLLTEGSTVASGGSMTLVQSGIMEHLKSGRYRYLDRSLPDMTPEQINAVYAGAFTADAYLVSSNAITEAGELYNVDGIGNRVAAMIYGPKNVIVIAGYNKIVRDLDEAGVRMKNLTAPANAIRLSRATPCTQTGCCMNCRSEERICCASVTLSKQRIKDRITVILVGEPLGY